MNRFLLGLATTATLYFGAGASDALALDCWYPSDCVCTPGVTTILHVSSAVYTEDNGLELEVVEAFGADIGVEAGGTIVLPNRPEAGPGENLLVYVVNGEVYQVREIDEDGNLDCQTTEPLDLATAVEVGLREDCNDHVSENLTPEDYCQSGACEATVGGKPGALASLLGLLGLGLFARRRGH